MLIFQLIEDAERQFARGEVEATKQSLRALEREANRLGRGQGDLPGGLTLEKSKQIGSRIRALRSKIAARRMSRGHTRR